MPTPKTVVKQHGSSNFNLTRVNRSSYAPGLIYPVFVEECIPGDRVNLSIDALIKTAPLLGPCMGRFKVMYTKFFCPTRNYVPAFLYNERKMKSSGISNTGFPFIQFGSPSGTDSNLVANYPVKAGSLLDHLGFPVGFQNRGTSAKSFNCLPVISYYDIVRCYFANQQAGYIDFYKSPFRNSPVVEGGSNVPYQINRTTLDDLDAFVSYWKQQNRVGRFHNASYVKGSGDWFKAIADAGLACMPVRPDYFYTLLDNDTFAKIESQTRMETQPGVDGGRGYITVDQIRMANKMQRFLELTLLGGTRYADWVRSAFVETIDDRLDQPIFLGATSTYLDFEDVVSTSASKPDGSSSATGLGDIGGRGYSQMRGKNSSYHVKEHGYFMVLMTIIPEIDYYQGVRKMWSKLQMSDIYVPQLDGLGFQDVSMSELCAVPSVTGRPNAGAPGSYTESPDIWNGLAGVGNAKDPFTVSIGKQPAWYEYMTSFNELHGQFVESLRFWTLSRDHFVKRWIPAADTYQTMASWIPYYWPVDFNYLFADNSVDAENFYIQSRFNAVFRRQMSKNIRPSIE